MAALVAVLHGGIMPLEFTIPYPDPIEGPMLAEVPHPDPIEGPTL